MSTIEKAMERLAGKGAAPTPIDTGAGAKATALDRSPADTKVGDRPVHVARTTGHKAAVATGERLAIDPERMRQAGLIVPGEGKTRITEEFRRIKRPLLANVEGRSAAPIANRNLIMVTSALPGEGKSFVAINLAISIAMEMDRTVLLMDADVEKPSVARILDLPGRPGLMDLLVDPTLDIPDVLYDTTIPKLRIIGAGRSDDRSTELLSSTQMRRLMAELADRYPDRVIIFDSPPLLATTQSSVLAELAGQILVVVEAGQTPQSAVEEAVAELDPEKAISLVLNKQVLPSPGGAYGYGYYGQYGD